MVGANKILTVSYGTFSCTLEGFDDSFATMKEIAEYFRDLAAQDRYFGAEPPTPDAEMLTRIAEREAHKPVAARVEDNNVILRVENSSAAAVAPASALAPTPEQVAPAAPFSEPTAPEDTLPTEPPTGTVAPSEMVEAESVADKLSRIRAVVERNQELSEAGQEEETSLADDVDMDEVPSLAELQSADLVQADMSTSELTDPEAFETIELNTDEPDTSFEAYEDLPPSSALNNGVNGELEEEETAGTATRSVKSVLFAPLQDDQSEFFDETYDDDMPEMSSALGSILPEQETANRQPERDHYFLSDNEVESSAAMDRLLKEADSQLSNPETSRRRSAISHLRAAVAATVAERKTSPETSSTKPMDEEAYRADLAEVVRPQHAPAEAIRPEKTDRPASPPLMLVSSQRVDESGNADEDETEETTMLRDQIRAHTSPDQRQDLPTDQEQDDDENIFASDASFANFVSATGASELVDLLEAAAAYTRFVEGVPQFKRPRIMGLVTGYAGKDAHSREEGLRAFGVLLREGRFEKVKRGYFQISDSTRFRPHERAAGE